MSLMARRTKQVEPERLEEEFKRLLHGEESLRSLATKLGVPESPLYDWHDSLERGMKGACSRMSVVWQGE